MNGKLARIEQQDQILAAQSGSCSSSPIPKVKEKKKTNNFQRNRDDIDMSDFLVLKEKKKKKDKRNKDKKVPKKDINRDFDNVLSIAKEKKKKKRKQKADKEMISNESDNIQHKCIEETLYFNKKSKRKKRKQLDDTPDTKENESEALEKNEIDCNDALQGNNTEKTKKEKCKYGKRDLENESQAADSGDSKKT